MSRPVIDPNLPRPAGDASERLAGVVLARLAAAPASEIEVARELHVLVAPRLTMDAWRTELMRVVARLTAAGHVAEAGGRLSATDDGKAAAQAFLGGTRALGQGWPALRDGALVAKTLGIEGQPAARLKALGKADGLRMLVVEAAWQLRLKGRPSAARIRSELAVVALGRAFGNQMTSALDAKSALPAKSARLLAGQLAGKPRDFRTDARLVAALAAEALGVRRGDLAELRLAALKRFVAGEPIARIATAKPAATSRRSRSDVRKPAAAGDVATPPANGSPVPAANGHTAPAAPAAPHAAATATAAAPIALDGRPDAHRFAATVKSAARTRAEGWAGNRRAFVSDVWDVVREQNPHWGLSEIEFKCMLTEAHRTGLIALSNADLKDKRQRRELEASAVTYKNTVWHYVRVED